MPTATHRRRAVHQKGAAVHAVLLGTPDGAVSIRAPGKAAKYSPAGIASVTLLGSDAKLDWSRRDDTLVIQKPQNRPGVGEVVVFKIETKTWQA